MKIMKSIIASLLSAALLFAGTSAFGVVAEGDMNLTVGSGSTTYDSSALDYPVITIPVTSDVTLDGVAGIAFTVSFDPTELSVAASSDYFTDFETQFSGTTAPTSVSVGGVLYTSPIVSNNITSGTTQQGLAVAAALADPADPGSAYELLSLDVSLVAGNPPGDYGITIVPTLIDNADAGWDSEESNLVIGVSGTSDFSTILAASDLSGFVIDVTADKDTLTSGETATLTTNATNYDRITGGTVTFSITDTDDDDMDDGWEEYWYTESGATITPMLSALSKGGDYDGDEIDDEIEFLAGTNPMETSGLTTELLFETFNNGGVQDKPWDGTGVDNVWTTVGTSIEIKNNTAEMKNAASCSIDLDTSSGNSVTISVNVTLMDTGAEWYVSFGGTEVLNETDGGIGTYSRTFDSTSNPEMFAPDATLELSSPLAFRMAFDNVRVVVEGGASASSLSNYSLIAPLSDSSAVTDAVYTILSGDTAGSLDGNVFTASSVTEAVVVTIQASVNEGSITDTVDITVNPEPVILSYLHANPASNIIDSGGSTDLLVLAVFSSGATSDVTTDGATTYSVDPPSAGSVTAGTFTASSVPPSVPAIITVSYVYSGVTETETMIISITAEGNGSSESGCFIGTISGLSLNLTHLFALGLSSSVCLMIRRKER
jgi:hypothetical protein